jgi:hypothetical protein
MSDISSQGKATPGRRRQPRNGKAAAGQKAYASENDAAMSDNHHTPQTPSKTGGPASPAPGSMPSAQSNSNKQRNKNKGKPPNKNAQQVSPESLKHGRSTPPHRPGSTKSGLTTAFAGATFHASPAPSALPIPSFLAKSSGDSPSGGRLKTIDPQYSPPANGTDATPSYAASAPKANESPLDFMFRAQKQERERQNMQTQPPPHNGSPSQYSNQYPQSPPRSAGHQAGRSAAKQTQGIDRAELDGTPGYSIGPAFSTPYHERINAAKAARHGSQQQHSSLNDSSAQNTSSDDATAALKKFLFGGSNGQAGPKPSLSSAPPTHHPNAAPQQAPSQMNGAGYGRGGNIQAMENDLRRILKLDSST